MKKFAIGALVGAVATAAVILRVIRDRPGPSFSDLDKGAMSHFYE
jgi:hypothetical protein